METAKIFQVGEIVEVKNSGQCYPTADALACELGISDTFKRVHCPVTGKYKVLGTCICKFDNERVYAIRGMQCASTYIVNAKAFKEPTNRAPRGATFGATMKINYNGQELETITEGYWPEGVTLVYSDSGTGWKEVPLKVICLHNGCAFYSDGGSGGAWKYWAVLPPKPAPRRLTNREVGELCKNGWDVCVSGLVGSTFWYKIDEDDIAI